jgi:hypothetical protein
MTKRLLSGSVTDGRLLVDFFVIRAKHPSRGAP